MGPSTNDHGNIWVERERLLLLENSSFIYPGGQFGQIAQSVEQRTENPCVAGSIPVLATLLKSHHRLQKDGQRLSHAAR